VKVSEEGAVTGMDAALEKLVDHYPWLSDEPLTSEVTLTSRCVVPHPHRRSAQAASPRTAGKRFRNGCPP
jgi:hypothetical protein